MSRSIFFMLFLAALFTSLPGCSTVSNSTSTANLPPGTKGIWRSNGYGYLIDSTGNHLRFYHLTDDVCVEDKETAVDLASYYFKKDTISYDSEGRHFYFSTPYEPYKIEFTSTPQLPFVCEQSNSDTPLGVFDAFASYMRTHYAFFDLYNVDWEASVEHARRLVESNTTDAQLFKLLSDLLRPLKDGHIELSATIDGTHNVYEPDSSTVRRALDKIARRDSTPIRKLNRKMLKHYWFEGIRNTILGGNGTLAGDDLIQYGIVSNDIGYLSLAVMGGYSGKGELHEMDDLVVLRATLDNAMRSFSEHSVKAVIVDLSINFGGYDFMALEIASYFASRRTLAYSKYAADSDSQKPFPLYVEHSKEQPFTGPVALVTSNSTISAAEILTMALRALPNVTHVGEPTRGAHSDSLNKRLPNGWSLNLSNEVYADHIGTTWEGRGITPEVQIDIFDRDNPFIGHTQTIAGLIKLIDDGRLVDRNRQTNSSIDTIIPKD